MQMQTTSTALPVRGADFRDAKNVGVMGLAIWMEIVGRNK
jgi:hypothetical protein